MGGANLIPVAVVRDIMHAVPVAGTFTGRSDAFLRMDVSVEVKELEGVKDVAQTECALISP